MKFHTLNRVELGRLAPEAVVVVPVGACEQHGPHLPVGTDFLLAESIADRAAHLIVDFPVLVTPAVSVGSSEHHVPFGGTISVSGPTLHRYLFEACDSLVRSGFRRIFLLNGHGGNVHVIAEVAREVAAAHDVVVGSGSYWTIAWDALVAVNAHLKGLLPGHAGAFESAMVLALLPNAADICPPVRKSNRSSDPRGFQRPYTVEDPSMWRRIDGFTDNPSMARVEDGERYLDVAVDAVSAAILEVHSRLA